MIVIVAFLSGLVGVLLGQSKNRQVEGFFLGLLFSVLGLLVLVFLPAKHEGSEPVSLFRVLVTVAVLGAVGFFGVRFVLHEQERREEIALAEPAAPATTPAPARLATAPQATPDPFAVAREIERKYGAAR